MTNKGTCRYCKNIVFFDDSVDDDESEEKAVTMCDALVHGYGSGQKNGRKEQRTTLSLQFTRQTKRCVNI